MLNFRELDELFQILYNHKDFILNFAFFEDCLTILMIILDKGNSFGGAINQFIKYFDGECLEKLKMSLNLLFENTKEIKIFLKKLITYQNRSISVFSIFIR